MRIREIIHARFDGLREILALTNRCSPLSHHLAKLTSQEMIDVLTERSRLGIPATKARVVILRNEIPAVL